MKHTNEVQAILTAIFAINRTSEHEDKEISLVLDYAFSTLSDDFSARIQTCSSSPV